jgi:hypothetical protein
VDTLEHGDIAFFYRPRVRAREAVVAPEGVQRFFVVLAPARGPARRLRIGRKHLPTTSGQRFWAEVERVGPLSRVLADQLEEEVYVTKTRGERVQPAARPIARGEYAFVRHDDHVHLGYRVEHTEPLDEIPTEVLVPLVASYVILWKRRPRAAANWTTEGAPSRLDREGEAIVLVAASDGADDVLANAAVAP